MLYIHSVLQVYTFNFCITHANCVRILLTAVMIGAGVEFAMETCCLNSADKSSASATTKAAVMLQ